MSEILTNAYVKVEHLTPDTNTNQEGYVLDLGLQAVPLNIQPSTPEVTALNNGMYGKSYTMFTTYSGILETDRITTVSGSLLPIQQFIVRGRQNYNYAYGQHIEAFCEEVQT